MGPRPVQLLTWPQRPLAHDIFVPHVTRCMIIATHRRYPLGHPQGFDDVLRIAESCKGYFSASNSACAIHRLATIKGEKDLEDSENCTLPNLRHLLKRSCADVNKSDRQPSDSSGSSSCSRTIATTSRARTLRRYLSPRACRPR